MASSAERRVGAAAEVSGCVTPLGSVERDNTPRWAQPSINNGVAMTNMATETRLLRSTTGRFASSTPACVDHGSALSAAGFASEIFRESAIERRPHAFARHDL